MEKYTSTKYDEVVFIDVQEPCFYKVLFILENMTNDGKFVVNQWHNLSSLIIQPRSLYETGYIASQKSCT